MYILKYASSCTRTKLLSKNKKKVCGKTCDEQWYDYGKSKIEVSIIWAITDSLAIIYKSNIYTLSKYMDTKFYSYICKYLLQSSAIHYIKGNY